MAVTFAVLTSVVAACADENGAPNVSVDSPELSPVSSATDGTAPTGAGARYVVIAGDSLSAIADRHCVSTSDLVSVSGWDDGIAHMIFPGDAVAVPSGACNASLPTDGDAPIATDAVTWPAGGWYSPYNFEFWDPYGYGSECEQAWHALQRVRVIEPSDQAEFLAALESLPNEVPAGIMATATRVARVYNEHKAEWARLEPLFYGRGDAARPVEYHESWEPLEQAYLDNFVVQDYVWGVCPQNYEAPPNDPSASPPRTIGPFVQPSASNTPPPPPTTFPPPASTQ
jgi:hypothetical protein